MVLGEVAVMNWDQIAADFAWDGSWRDIYILNATMADWAKVWDLLGTDPTRLNFRVYGVPAPPPTQIEEVFAQREAVFASYQLGPVTLNCHFFAKDEIEFDLDPREVDGPAAAGQISAFLAALGRATAKEVILTAENAPEAVIARFRPDVGEVEWIPGGALDW